MTRTYLQARTILTNILNSNCLDPYPGTRSGKHFFEESDGINLSRANTFPKGYVIKTSDDPLNNRKNFYTSGWNDRKAIFSIHYLVKDMISYTDSLTQTKYKDIDYVEFMKEKIVQTLSNNINMGDGFFIEDIGNIQRVTELTGDGLPFKLYEGIVPVTVKWVNKYGN